jgi:hypothetical protein
MTWWLLGVLGLGFAGGSASATDRPLDARDARTAWMTDYTAAKAAARQSGKPIFVVFR